MNRCCICDITDEDNPKAGITFYTIEVVRDLKLDDKVPYYGTPMIEARCLACHSTVQENLEDLSIADEDFSFQDNSVSLKNSLS